MRGPVYARCIHTDADPGPPLKEMSKGRVARSATFETALRDYCGALVTSPQFTLAGLPLVTTVTLPALQICPAGETCDVAALQAQLISQIP